jgi:hypothetical protein
MTLIGLPTRTFAFALIVALVNPRTRLKMPGSLRWPLTAIVSFAP